MAVSLRKGEKFNLAAQGGGLQDILIGLRWDTNQYSGGLDFDLDVAAFLTEKSGLVGDNEDFVYYGNLTHRSGGLTHMGDSLVGGAEGDDEQIRIRLPRIPLNIERIVIAVSIYEAAQRRQNFGQVENACVCVTDEVTGQELARFALDEDFSTCTSVVIGEVYRYKGGWRFGAVGSGCQGELKEICRRYGVDTELPPPHRGAVILKKGRKITLSEETAQGDIRVSLNWSRPSRGKGVDLDIACLYELTGGQKYVVQALGDAFGRLNDPPYIMLDRDDKYGSQGENLIINGTMLHKIKRVLIYAFIYDGIADWRQADGVVTVQCPGRRDIVVKMDEYHDNRRVCAIAYMENTTGSTLSMEKVVRFFGSHHEMSEAFDWGMRWQKGSKAD